MTVADVLDGAFRMLRSTFGRSALLVLIILGPYQLLSSLVLTTLVPEVFGPPSFAPTEPVEIDLGNLVATLGTWGVVLQVLGLLVNVLVATAVVALVLQADRGQAQDVGQALRTSLARSGATVGGSVLALFVVLLAAVVLVPLAIALVFVPVLGWLALLVIVPVVFAFAIALVSLIVPVATVEERGAWTTFTRALWVIRVRPLRVLGIALLLGLILGVVAGIVALPLTLLSFVAGPLSWVADGLSSTLISVLTVPVTAYAALLVYLDARVRVEALDLELRTRGLSGS